jgi:LuxR family maltose regulon positive regulatory protein
MDDERRWYRYHPLFRDLLRQRAARGYPAAEIQEWHLRAGSWFARNDLVDEAILHWLEAGEYRRAADAIARIARSRLAHGEGNSVRRWLDALPTELVRDDPHLSLANATALTFVRDIEGVETHLENVERALQGDRRDVYEEDEVSHLLGGVAVYRAMVALWRGETDLTLQQCQLALDHLRGEDTYLQGLALLLQGSTHHGQGHLSKASQGFQEALEIGRETGDVMLFNTAANNLAGVHTIQGELHAAVDIYQEALSLARDSRNRPYPVAGGSLVGLARIHREWNHLKEAQNYADQALSLGRDAGLESVIIEAAITKALIQWAKYDWDGSRSHLQRAERLAQRYHRQGTLPLIAALRAKIDLTQGRLRAAEGWAQGCGLHLTDKPELQLEVPYLVLVSVVIHQAKERGAAILLGEAIQLLIRLRQQSDAHGRTGSLIAISIQEALAYDVTKDDARAMASLKQALALGEVGGYVRQFLDEGEPIARLLRRVVPQTDGSTRLYAASLLGAWKAISPPSPPEARNLVEPLTQRQIEVLSLIAAGLSNQEISDTLVIALSTTKKHINHIYGKLRVSSRTKAVARARELGLVE